MAFCSLVVAATNSPTAADEVLGLKTSSSSGSSAEQPDKVGGIAVASTQTVLTYSFYPTASRRETIIPPSERTTAEQPFKQSENLQTLRNLLASSQYNNEITSKLALVANDQKRRLKVKDVYSDAAAVAAPAGDVFFEPLRCSNDEDDNCDTAKGAKKFSDNFASLKVKRKKSTSEKLTKPAAAPALVIPSLSLNVVRDSPGFSPIKTATTIASTPRRTRRAPTLTNNYGFSSAGLSSATSSSGWSRRQRVVPLVDESERSGSSSSSSVAKFPLGTVRVSPSHNEITRRIRFDKPRRLRLRRRREKRFTGENVKNDRLTFRHKEDENENDKIRDKKTNVRIRPSSSSSSSENESKALVSAGVRKDKARANPLIRTEISSIMPFTAAEIYQQQRQHIEKPIVSKATTSASSSLSSSGKSRIRSSGIKDQQFPRTEARFELFSRTSSEEKPKKKVKPTAVAAAITSASTPRSTKTKIIKTKTAAEPTSNGDDNYSCRHLLNNRPVDEWSSTTTGQLSFHCSSAPKEKRSPNSTELELPRGGGNKEVKKKLLDHVGVTASATAAATMDHHQLHQWPIKLSAEVEGDLILGGLMMVHEREDSITCGPVMPQGGVQALEAMLYTLDKLNAEKFVPGVKVGAHILDDCDKDTYGLEMAVDFIKGVLNIVLRLKLNITNEDSN
ncbi:hypothetical protein TKK_0006692 [Trichogramma kaykai]